MAVSDSQQNKVGEYFSSEMDPQMCRTWNFAYLPDTLDRVVSPVTLRLQQLLIELNSGHEVGDGTYSGSPEGPCW